MCFFSKMPKTEDVFNYFKEQILNWDMAGYPKMEERTNDNFFVDKWCGFDKKKNKISTSFTLHVENNGWEIDYAVFYFKYKNEINWFVGFKNFDRADFYIDASVRMKFPKLNIVSKSNQVYAEAAAEVKTMDDVVEFMKKWRKDFTESGFFEYIKENYPAPKRSFFKEVHIK